MPIKAGNLFERLTEAFANKEMGLINSANETIVGLGRPGMFAGMDNDGIIYVWRQSHNPINIPIQGALLILRGAVIQRDGDIALDEEGIQDYQYLHAIESVILGLMRY